MCYLTWYSVQPVHGGSAPAPQGGNRRVGSVGGSGSGGNYWWQQNNPFVNAGSRRPSKPQKPHSGSGGVKRPSSTGSKKRPRPPVQQPHPAPGAGAPRPPVSVSQPGPIIIPNVVNQMGICPPNFVCVHCQLCKRGQVILDGSGVIDKSRRCPATQVNMRHLEKFCLF